MDLKSIHEIFSNRILRIPSYQRGYSWSSLGKARADKPEENNKIKGQLMDLWNDIINIPEDRWHYTGLLTLVEAKQLDYKWLPNHKQYEIVDGQQRITSILILIQVMVEQAATLDLELGVREGEISFQYLHIEKQGAYAYIFGYDQDNPSDKFFRRHILGLNQVEDDSKESIYTENLRKSKEFLRCMVTQFISSDDSESAGAISKADNLQKLFNRVTGDLRMNEYILPKELDEYVVFETMNNRGKPLSELEKLKNRLMYLADKFGSNHNGDNESSSLIAAQKKQLCDAINKGWITIYQALGENKSAPLDDEDFIKNHWIAYFDNYNRSEANVYANHLFKDHFTIERVYRKEITPNDILDFVRSLQLSSIIWNKIHNPNFFSSDESVAKSGVLGLHRVGFRASYRPLVLATLLQLPNSSENIDTFFALLEQHSFKLFHISSRRSNTGDSKLYRLAHQVLSKEITIENACDHLKWHINEYYWLDFYKNLMTELFDSRSQQGFYAWSGRHYFLYEYDLELRSNNSTTTAATELNWEDFSRKNTIEHIFPQSAAKSWEDFAEEDVSVERKNAYEKLQNNWSLFSDYTPSEKKRLSNSLGNLLPISHSDNASFSNDPFLYKVDQSNKGEKYRNRGYRHDSMSAQLVAKEPDWTPGCILERGITMIDSLLRQLEETTDRFSRREKIQLLGLEFMIENNNEEGATA